MLFGWAAGPPEPVDAATLLARSASVVTPAISDHIPDRDSLEHPAADVFRRYAQGFRRPSDSDLRRDRRDRGGTVEQPELDHLGVPADQLVVDGRHGDLPVLQRRSQRRAVEELSGGRLQVQPGVGGADRAVHGAEVGEDEPVEAPLPLEDGRQDEAVLAVERTVDLRVRAHDRADLGLLDRRLERRQVDLAHRPLGDVVVDAEPVGFLVVAEVVLGVGDHPVCLDRLDVAHREARREVRVLAVPLEGAPVHWYPGDVDGRTLKDVAADRERLGTLDVAVRVGLAQVPRRGQRDGRGQGGGRDRKSTRLNSSHVRISYAVFCLKKKKTLYVVFGLYKKKEKSASKRLT